MKNIFLTIFAFVLLGIAVPQAMAQSVLLKEADEYFEQFAFPKAIELYLKVLDKDRENPQALERIADCYRLTSQTRKAELYYKKAIKANKNNKNKSILQLYYAQSVMSNKNYADALIAFEEYVRLKPDDSRGWNFADYCRNINEYMRDSSQYSVNRLAINCPESDMSPTFYGEGIVFESARPRGLLDAKSDWTGESRYDMFFTQENAGKWLVPAPLKGKPESSYEEGPTVFNAQNTVMYFTRNLGKNKAKNGTVRLGIFQANKVGDEWVGIKEMPFNNEAYSVGHPALSSDGKTLYFASDMMGSRGGKDIYMSQFKNGTWTKPENLGASVNTEGDEMFPFMHADGTLYFASNGWGGFGGLDVFAARPVEEDWLVINMGYPINTSRDDFGLILNANKTVGYLSSNRQGERNSDDIYKISIQPAKAKQLMVKGASPTMALLPAVAEQPIAMLPVATAPATPPPAKTIASPSDILAKNSKSVAKTYQPTPPPVAYQDPPDTKKISPQQPAQPQSVEPQDNTTTAIVRNIIPQPAADQTPFNGYKPISNARTNRNDAPQLVLMGIVVNKINNEPLPDATVMLEDSDTKEVSTVVTGENGNFVFRLMPEKKYTLSKLFGGKQEDFKKISTYNKNEPELLHAILNGTPSDRQYRGLPNEAAAKQPTPPKHSRTYLEEEEERDPDDYYRPVPVSDPAPIAAAPVKKMVIAEPDVPKIEQKIRQVPTNVDGLLFKIQIGSFTHFRSTAHRFFDGVRQEINTGKLKIENSNGLTRYIIGTYANYEEAEHLRQTLLNKYPDAYVAGYVNGYRIEKPIEEILQQYR